MCAGAASPAPPKGGRKNSSESRDDSNNFALRSSRAHATGTSSNDPAFFADGARSKSSTSTKQPKSKSSTADWRHQVLPKRR